MKMMIRILVVALIFVYVSNAKPMKSNDECHLERRLPEALIIGVKKSGTYALLKYLSINPQIGAALRTNGCDLNEIHFFDSDENYARGIDWYRSKMPRVCAARRVMVIEKTPGYLRSARAAERVFAFNSSIRLVLIVREPVKRVQSDLTHCDIRQKSRNLTRTCARMNEKLEEIFADGSDLNAEQTRRLEAIEHIGNSLYYDHLSKWVAHFNLSNIYVVNGDAFIVKPWIELNKLEKFLNVDSYIREEHFYFDEKKRFYCVRSDQTMSNQGCLSENKGRKNQVFLSQMVRDGLRRYFRRKNEQFFQLIGKSFNW